MEDLLGRLLQEFRDQWGEDHPDYHTLGRIDEAGLARLLSRVSDEDGNITSDFAVVTGFRDKYDLKTNRKRNQEIAAILNQKKLGPYLLKGYWQEMTDEAKAEDLDYLEALEQGKTVKVNEDSMLVVRDPKSGVSREEFEQLIRSIGKRYEQDSVIFGYADGEFYTEYLDSGRRKPGKGTVTVGSISDAYSEMSKGEKERPGKAAPIPFVFEGLLVPHSFTRAGLLMKQGFNSVSLSGGVSFKNKNFEVKGE